jgi:hypothetical protein
MTFLCISPKINVQLDYILRFSRVLGLELDVFETVITFSVALSTSHPLVHTVAMNRYLTRLWVK